MSERKTAPVAYVTKWATTQGILVVKDAEMFEEYLSKGTWLFVSPRHWTTDKAEAETRYRAALLKASQAAFKKHAAIVAAINAPPKYTEDES